MQKAYMSELCRSAISAKSGANCKCLPHTTDLPNCTHGRSMCKTWPDPVMVPVLVLNMKPQGAHLFLSLPVPCREHWLTDTLTERKSISAPEKKESCHPCYYCIATCSVCVFISGNILYAIIRWIHLMCAL